MPRRAPAGLWANVWQGELTRRWFAIIRRGEDVRPLATLYRDTEAAVREAAAREIARMNRQEVLALARVGTSPEGRHENGTAGEREALRPRQS